MVPRVPSPHVCDEHNAERVRKTHSRKSATFWSIMPLHIHTNVCAKRRAHRLPLHVGSTQHNASRVCRCSLCVCSCVRSRAHVRYVYVVRIHYGEMPVVANRIEYERSELRASFAHSGEFRWRNAKPHRWRIKLCSGSRHVQDVSCVESIFSLYKALSDGRSYCMTCVGAHGKCTSFNS